jgi:hypothetical protein
MPSNEGFSFLKEISMPHYTHSYVLSSKPDEVKTTTIHAKDYEEANGRMIWGMSGEHTEAFINPTITDETGKVYKIYAPELRIYHCK